MRTLLQDTQEQEHQRARQAQGEASLDSEQRPGRGNTAKVGSQGFGDGLRRVVAGTFPPLPTYHAAKGSAREPAAILADRLGRAGAAVGAVAVVNVTDFSYLGCGTKSTLVYVLRRVSTAVETSMRLSRTVLAAGAAVLALTGLAGVASAETANTHVMTVRLPDGTIEQIRYSGNVLPQVVVAPNAVAVESPFAMLDRMTALMDRQAEAMIRTINAMMAQPFPAPTTEAAFGAVPVGAGVCMRSVQITYTGHGQPQVVSRTAGDCGAADGTAAPVQLPAPSAP